MAIALMSGVTRPAAAWGGKGHDIERSIIFMAGVLGHWITDTSQPMHSSIHVHGWAASAPNPSGYVGKNLHYRYETEYVVRAISLDQVAAHVDHRAQVVGDWLREAEKHIAAANRHVEQIYVWDLETPFGSGKEPAEAAPFTAARLADGARTLRNIWYSAWVRSNAPLPGFEKSVSPAAGKKSE